MPTIFLFHLHFIRVNACLFVCCCFLVMVAKAGLWHFVASRSRYGSLLRLNMSFMGKMKLLRETVSEICIMKTILSIIYSAAAPKTFNIVLDHCLHSRFINSFTDKQLFQYCHMYIFFFFFLGKVITVCALSLKSHNPELFLFPLRI